MKSESGKRQTIASHSEFLDAARTLLFGQPAAVGVTLALTTARVCVSAILAMASVLAATPRSQPTTRLAPPVSMRVAFRSCGRAATCTMVLVNTLLVSPF